MPVLITGNTYPVRQQLARLGGKWNPQAKAWEVPDAQASAAQALVSGAGPRKPLSRSEIIALGAKKRGETPGVCAACGDKCKFPFTECWGCREEREMGY